MDRSTWIEHRRGDGERVGWIRPDGDGFVPIDLLGRELGPAMDWLHAEETLEERGLGWLAEPWALEVDGREAIRVRLVEVTPDRVVVKDEDWGDMNATTREHVLPFPAPARLRPWTSADRASPFA